MKDIKEVIHSDIHSAIKYEWDTLRACLDKQYIRGMYDSLDRLCRLYKKRDIKL